MRNHFSVSAWLLAIACGLLAPGWVLAEPTKKPNVLLIVCDDLNTNLGCFGHPLVKSPHIDKLAARGVRFERAYTQYPICNPSRTSFLSGVRPGTGSNAILKGAVWLPMLFRNNGYVVVQISKVAHTAAMSKLCAFEPRKTVADVVGQVREFVAENKQKPFFLAVGLTGTHSGYQSKPEFRKLYPPDKMTWEKEPADIRANVPAVAFEGYLSFKRTDAERREHLASYYAAISTLDAQVGAILAVLEQQGVLDDTIILFTSDHGRHMGEHGGIYDKRSLFEESLRVPLIVHAPGKTKPGVSPRLVEMVDYYPTLVDLCGLPMPKHLEGTSFAPLLLQADRPWKKAAFSQSGVSGKMGHSVGTERYRYTEWDAKTGQLYDHQTDPREQVNLFGDPQHAKMLAEMRQLMQAGWKGAVPGAGTSKN